MGKERLWAVGSSALEDDMELGPAIVGTCPDMCSGKPASHTFEDSRLGVLMALPCLRALRCFTSLPDTCSGIFSSSSWLLLGLSMLASLYLDCILLHGLEASPLVSYTRGEACGPPQKHSMWMQCEVPAVQSSDASFFSVTACST